MCCYLTRTTSRTHQIIKDNLHETPTYGGWVEAKGPRYCPSIEDKVCSESISLINFYSSIFGIQSKNQSELVLGKGEICTLQHEIHWNCSYLFFLTYNVDNF